MLWIFAIVLVLACLGVLAVGQRRPVATTTERDTIEPDRAFFRSQLDGIDSDVASGRMSTQEAEAARAELAREVIRHKKDGAQTGRIRNGRMAVLAALPVIALASIAVYAMIGRADLPAQPLAGREFPAMDGQMSIDDAVARVEAQMEQTPNDVRGWLVLAPIYMNQQRYAEAANAWRRVLDLEPPTADRRTNLAEALMMANGGDAPPEAIGLLQEAAESDPSHVRSRIYLAAELTQEGAFAEAVTMWQGLLDTAEGSEPWVPVAREGLVAAQAGLQSQGLGDSEPDATMDVMIRGMVDGLAARIAQDGGSADEWMQLVRSRQQLDGDEAAMADVERGLAALEGTDRRALETYAQELGLTGEQ